jgi:tetratricopeptide (TPR) repeat protein
MPHETVAQAADVLLEVLGALGVPGTSLARRAVGGVESLRRSQAARQRLEGLLQEAEEDFVQQAREQGLETVAQWVASLPVQNLPTFRQALESLRTHWDEGELTERLAQEFARLPGVPTEQQARALALYLACLRARLLADKGLGPVVVALSTLRTEAGVERLLEAVDALYGAVNRLLGLPADLVAWPVQTLSEITELRADLLLPAYRLVPYTGRAFQETRADLLGWARGLEAARPPVGLRTYIGPGGAGKTRLLIEVGQALREEGWWVGFLRAGRLTKENVRILGTDARPTLLIVDYIANRDKEVRILLHEAARACGERAAPLAVVLLERAFPDWLREDLHTYTDPEYVGWPAFLGLATVEKEPRHLPDLAPDDRRMLFRTAREQFAKILRADGRPLPDYADLPDAPLYVLLLALLAAAGERVERPTDPEQVLECTWSRERAAWKRHLEPLFRNQPEARLNRAVEVVEDLAVLATLGRAFADPPAAAAFLQAHFQPIPGVTWDELADLLPVLFPRRVPGSLIPPVVPDPLADFVLRRRLAERPDRVPLALPGPEEAEAEPEEAVRAAGEALGVLARLWERAREGQERDRAAGWMRAAAERLAAWPASAWTSLARALPVPDRTLALRPFLADFYRARQERLSPEAAEERAGVLVMLGWALSALGRREEALTATQEAVKIYRQLAQQNPQAFLPDLAATLNNLGRALSALGWREEALAATQGAADLYRDLARANPQAFLPYLATSLNNLGSDLSALGRREEALKATQESVDIRRKLAEQNPQAFLPDLATSLNNLGLMLSALGRREEALAATQEAADLYRDLARANPQAFLPDLARSLNNLGRALSALGRREEALAATQEAADIYRDLARANPQAFLPYLAASLNNLGLMLSALGRREEALAATQEAADLYRGLAQANPQAFLPDLAMSLNNLGMMLSALGRREEALTCTQEAADLYRDLARANPPAFRPDLATSLNNLGGMLSALGRREEALTATQEAVDIYRDLARANPQAFLPYLAMSLNNLGYMLSALGRREEALTCTQEAADLYRALARANPQAFLPDLAMSLNNLGRALSALGRREEALTCTQEAADLYRGLARANPQAFLPDLAMSLNNLGAMLSALGRREEALTATQEAVKIYRQLAQQNPPAFLPDLARSLGTHGSVLRGLGRHAEAAAAFAEGLRAILPFVRALPAAFGGLADALLQYYLWACQEAGEAPDAGLVEEVLQVIGQPVAIHPAVVGLAPLLLAVAAMAQGAAGPEVAGAVEEALAGMRQQEEWRALAEALGRLLAGERDPQALRRGLALDEVDERALALAEGAVAGDERALVLLAALGGD